LERCDMAERQAKRVGRQIRDQIAPSNRLGGRSGGRGQSAVSLGGGGGRPSRWRSPNPSSIDSSWGAQVFRLPAPLKAEVRLPR
jgi:hypothetical protein